MTGPRGNPPPDPAGGHGPGRQGRHSRHSRPEQPAAPPRPPRRARPPRPPIGRRHRRRSVPSFAKAVARTAISTIVPGLGLLGTPRRRLGAAALVVFAILVGAVVWQSRSLSSAARWLVDPALLLFLAVGLMLVGVGWAAIVLTTYRTAASPTLPKRLRVIGSVGVGIVAFAIMGTSFVGASMAVVHRNTLLSIFAGERGAVDVDRATWMEKWEKRERVNFLLLGADSGHGRVGTRTDTVLVASVDTRSGDTTLISLPRNLELIPFPPGSKLAAAHPGGVYNGPGDRLEWMLTSMYRNVPRRHPGLLRTSNPGAEALRQGVGEALGLEIDYYVMINLNGFIELVQALGGITVNVNERVPIGGSQEAGRPPKGWIEPGPNQHLWGYRALWFARGRYGSDDFHRMRRQRCAMKAMIEQADVPKLLRRYNEIVSTSKDMVRTDIPSEHLPRLVEIATSVRTAQVRSLVFDNEVIRPFHPDYDLMRSMVSQAIGERPPTPRPSASAPESTPQGRSESPSESSRALAPRSDRAGDHDTEQPANRLSMGRMCAYRPGR